jgi:hypothetical protein
MRISYLQRMASIPKYQSLDLQQPKLAAIVIEKVSTTAIIHVRNSECTYLASLRTIRGRSIA